MLARLHAGHHGVFARPRPAQAVDEARAPDGRILPVADQPERAGQQQRRGFQQLAFLAVDAPAVEDEGLAVARQQAGAELGEHQRVRSRQDGRQALAGLRAAGAGRLVHHRDQRIDRARRHVDRLAQLVRLQLRATGRELVAQRQRALRARLVQVDRRLEGGGRQALAHLDHLQHRALPGQRAGVQPAAFGPVPQRGEQAGAEFRQWRAQQRAEVDAAVGAGRERREPGRRGGDGREGGIRSRRPRRRRWGEQPGQRDGLAGRADERAGREPGQRPQHRREDRDATQAHHTGCGHPSDPQVTLLMNSTGAPLFCAS